MKGDVAAADAVRPAQIQPPSMGSIGKETTCFSGSQFCSQFLGRKNILSHNLNSSMVTIFYVVLPLEEVLGEVLHFQPRCIHLIMTLLVPRRYAPCHKQAEH